MEELIIGNTVERVEYESFYDPETGRIRVRPVEGQGLPTNLVIECPTSLKMEPAHLIHPDNSRVFDEVDKVIPDHQRKHEWLKLNGAGMDL